MIVSISNGYKYLPVTYYSSNFNYKKYFDHIKYSYDLISRYYLVTACFVHATSIVCICMKYDTLCLGESTHHYI